MGAICLAVVAVVLIMAAMWACLRLGAQCEREEQWQRAMREANERDVKRWLEG